MFQPVRGTHDVLPLDAQRQNSLITRARTIAATYGYDEIITPIFEFSGVFHRLGETSDIVSKETYTFTDRGGEEITLRPEGTAPVVRAVISNSLTQSVPLKFFYAGPMFRYDRPQKGRYRQFDQIGVELIGVPGPLADIEVIAMGYHLLKNLGLHEQITLEINTLGDRESRDAYRTALHAYFNERRAALSQDSQDRLDRNPLRILDSKDAGDRTLIKDAPLYQDFLNEDSRAFYASVKAGLEALHIPFVENPRLVRGLDYYCHTAFEFTSSALGAQGTVLAGGRYDRLMEMMGGPDLPGVGWAAGVARLDLLATLPAPTLESVAVVPLGEAAEAHALTLTQTLRTAGIRTDLGFSGNLAKRMKRADKIQATFALILGDDELEARVCILKDLSSGQQDRVPLDQIVTFVHNKLLEKQVSS